MHLFTCYHYFTNTAAINDISKSRFWIALSATLGGQGLSSSFLILECDKISYLVKIILPLRGFLIFSQFS